MRPSVFGIWLGCLALLQARRRPLSRARALRYPQPMTAIPAPAAPVASTSPRNRLGVVAFVLALVVVAVPIVVAIVTAIVGSTSGDTPGAGWSVLGGFILGAVALALISPVAVVAVVLAIISLFRRRGRNGLGVWGLVLAILPALIGPFLIPAALDTLF